MKIDVKALGITFGIIWAASVLAVGIAHLCWPAYGGAFLNLVAAIYPGVHLTDGFEATIVATLYAFVDGAVGGALMAWLYNRLAAGGK